MTEGELAWGGVEPIGHLGSFYVSVTGKAPVSAQDSEFLDLMNVTDDITSM